MKLFYKTILEQFSEIITLNIKKMLLSNDKIHLVKLWENQWKNNTIL